MLICQKFGGTSVGTPERVRRVASRIAEAYQQGHQLVVVVSAMGHTTDELIDLAHQVSKNPPCREMDMLLTTGERISMALLCMALSDLGVPALSLTGSQSGIVTDGSHRRARIRKILGHRVRSALTEGKVVIVAGFQGVSETKEITTLGRGGSDTTAVALAAVLKADACEIFTDVDGVYSADPRIVKNAKLWKALPHTLMVEMATRGAGVLHPRSVELAKQYNVPLRVRNSLDESEGTRVHSPKSDQKMERMEEYAVTGVVGDREKVLLDVVLARPTVGAAVWDRAASSHLSIIAPVFSEDRVRFFSDRDGEAEWRKHLEDLVFTGFVTSYQIHSDIVPLSVVGDRFSQDGLALYEILEILSRHCVPVKGGIGSALAVTVGVSLEHLDEGVKCLHRELIEGNRK